MAKKTKESNEVENISVKKESNTKSKISSTKKVATKKTSKTTSTKTTKTLQTDKPTKTNKNIDTTKSASTKKAVNTTKSASTKKAVKTTKSANAKKALNTTKSASTKKAVNTTKSANAKKALNTTKSANTKKAVNTTKVVAKETKTKPKRNTTPKTSTTKKKNAAKKTAKVKATSIAKSTKTTKTPQTKKEVSKKVVTKEEVFESEYYDLPYSYNKTVIKLLAQTPKTLFIYWEISEEDKEYFKKTYGENFFEITKPVLIVHNDTLNYSFEVEINDFANSWYLHINDSKCIYHVELGRRPLPTANQHIYEAFESEAKTEDFSNKQIAYIPYYIYLTSSNNMDAPNNKILFNPEYKTVIFRNVKTGQITEKDIKDFTFVTNLGIFNIRDLYRFLSKDEYEKFDFENTPSSGNPSSLSFSSQFK